MVLGRVRLGRPMTLHAVGRWPATGYRHCIQLSYNWRGEWDVPPAGGPDDDGPVPTP